MIAWLWDLLFHRHKWVVVKKGSLLYENGNKLMGSFYELQCKKCGNLKYKELY